MEQGFLIGEKMSRYRQKGYEAIDDLLDSFMGPTRQGKELLSRKSAHYFFDEWEIRAKAVEKSPRPLRYALFN